jgi:hypothetical protein
MCYDAGWTRMEKPIWGTVREVVSCELVDELGAGATGRNLQFVRRISRTPDTYCTGNVSAKS